MIQALHTQRRERSSDCSSKWVTTKSIKILYVFNLYLNQPLNTFERKKKESTHLKCRGSSSHSPFVMVRGNVITCVGGLAQMGSIIFFCLLRRCEIILCYTLLDRNYLSIPILA
uniref:Uncharacterized protein n=1 Tax=Picea glauca TaxID=3330 RepID=A0A124GMT8_PICGL|nr:hypothetical protein ABT39_MTgene1398 [Picea glauca]QHR89450.1 hypothetical protein Q903MT_gene3471 [Picea sitchensis]